MNHDINEFNSSDRLTNFSEINLDVRDPISSAIEKDKDAVGNFPDRLDLTGWEDRSIEREANATTTETTKKWLKQFGTDTYDRSYDIATDSKDNIYLTGSTDGDIAGNNAGRYDAWVAKYDSNGDRVWIQQFGTSEAEESLGIAIDSSDNVYLTGYTSGDLAGNSDAWVSKYSSNGDRIWFKQFGSANDDSSSGIAIDSSNNVYLTGYTFGDLAGTNPGSSDAWIAKYSSNGDRVWIKQFGSSSSDYSNDIAIDSKDNIYLTGTTTGDLAETNTTNSYDAWVTKYSSNGDRVWIKQFGSSGWDFSEGIAIDSNDNIYLTGSTDGTLAGNNLGWSDVWVARYDRNGDRVWIKQFGSSSSDYSKEIAIDSNDNIYLNGFTYGDLEENNPSSSNEDVWIVKYDLNGDRLWTKEFGSIYSDTSGGIATDSKNNIYLTGYTYGNLAEKNSGESDIWVAKTNSLLSTQPIVSITASDAIAAETLSSETIDSGEFIITRTGDTTDPLTVNYSIGGQATNGEDYPNLTRSIIIPAGQNKVSLPIEIIDDNKAEYTEKIIVSLEPNFFYGVDKDRSATVTIADNDKPVVSISGINLKASETRTTETTNPARLKIRRAGDLSKPLTVSYRVNGTAIKGTDYKLPSKITFPAGVNTIGVSMYVIDDELIEELERANVLLTANPNYNVAKARLAKVSIADNDRYPIVLPRS
jgi:hypothetical protein